MDLFFLISWQVFDPIHRKLVLDTPYRPEVILHSSSIDFLVFLQANPDVEIYPHREECRGEYTTYWFLLLVIYKGLLMVCNQSREV